MNNEIKVDNAIRYEIMGNNYKALEIYSAVLKVNNNSKEAIKGIKRLSGARKKFRGINKEVLNFFITMDSNSSYNKFEKWLIGEEELWVMTKWKI